MVRKLVRGRGKPYEKRLWGKTAPGGVGKWGSQKRTLSKDGTTGWGAVRRGSKDDYSPSVNSGHPKTFPKERVLSSHLPKCFSEPDWLEPWEGQVSSRIYP